MNNYQSLIHRLYFLYKSYRCTLNLYQHEFKNKNSDFISFIDINSDNFSVFSKKERKLIDFIDIPKNEVLIYHHITLINFRKLINITIKEIREYKKKYPNYKPFYFYQIKGMLEEYSTYLFFIARYKNSACGRDNAIYFYNSLNQKKSQLKVKK